MYKLGASGAEALVEIRRFLLLKTVLWASPQDEAMRSLRQTDDTIGGGKKGLLFLYIHTHTHSMYRHTLPGQKKKKSPPKKKKKSHTPIYYGTHFA